MNFVPLRFQDKQQSELSYQKENMENIPRIIYCGFENRLA